ncbi:helix-turn-helix domain-containing protein [Cupriavidus campinensis]|uniref:Helix-turn-helix transcriptional regulator n=1 Tax=Cupriavidus campinensis TaxID=151783 RepID=A0ABY3EJE1_9BURK|nr:helix-turn-helix transcriptional regulator [Cupriavidus campinensis]TSP10969.1 helix-turn-helix transcriptional regulator [Cupriavidus campinensis]
MDLFTVGKQVRTRRESIGLTQERLAKLAGLSRETVQRLEAGTLNDLGFQRVARLLSVVGLDFDTLSLERRKKKHGLWMAAKSASVSYRGDLSPSMLEATLATGNVPVGFEAHIGHLLDETPVEVVVMAVEEAAEQESVSPASIWAQVSHLASHFASARKELWA